MITDYQKIRTAIEDALICGKSHFIIYPYGEYGVLTKQILNDSFGITEDYVIDNKLSRFNCNIKNLSFCSSLERDKYTVLLTCANPDVYDEVLNNLKQYFTQDEIIEIFEVHMNNNDGGGVKYTQCGKYSYGPLCNHWLVESVGAFCGFAAGSDVTENHPVDLISPHPFLYRGKEANNVFDKYYEEYSSPWCFPDVKPHGYVRKLRRIKIGNDVWIGRNVLITNGANIGNGVFAGAGAVITKDVPDYAVVLGVPARIVRYRYTPEQIEKLNKIAWWDWPDELIRERYDDFYLDIDKFIDKYYGE